MSPGRQQILPENREGAKVSDMAVGDEAFIVKWGMWVDAQRRCWLHPDYTVSEFPWGTSNMRIERHADGYHVWAPPGATWNPQQTPSYHSPADTEYIPLVKLHDVHRTSR